MVHRHFAVLGVIARSKCATVYKLKEKATSRVLALKVFSQRKSSPALQMKEISNFAEFDLAVNGEDPIYLHSFLQKNRIMFLMRFIGNTLR